jgi:predicted RNase H-like nuclease (RuvC/YqgF family)
MTDERKEWKTVRQAARERRGLDGPDAQALEGALTQTENELRDCRAERDQLRERVRELETTNSVLATRVEEQAEYIKQWNNGELDMMRQDFIALRHAAERANFHMELLEKKGDRYVVIPVDCWHPVQMLLLAQSAESGGDKSQTDDEKPFDDAENKND